MRRALARRAGPRSGRCLAALGHEIQRSLFKGGANGGRSGTGMCYLPLTALGGSCAVEV